MSPHRQNYFPPEGKYHRQPGTPPKRVLRILLLMMILGPLVIVAAVHLWHVQHGVPISMQPAHVRQLPGADALARARHESFQAGLDEGQARGCAKHPALIQPIAR